MKTTAAPPGLPSGIASGTLSIMNNKAAVLSVTAAAAVALSLSACGSVPASVTHRHHSAAHVSYVRNARPAVLGSFGGPVRVKVTSCGRLTARQRTVFGTNATIGMTAIVRNVGAIPVVVHLAAEFTRPGLVVDTNTAISAVLQSGQAQNLEIDNVPAGAASDACVITGYGTTTGPEDSGFTQYGS